MKYEVVSKKYLCDSKFILSAELKDYEKTRRYNQLVKDDIKEEEYWKGMQNTNHLYGKKGKSNSGNGNNDDSPTNDDNENGTNSFTKWTNNRGRGGRLPSNRGGRGSGRKSREERKADEDNMTKLQKRRKDANKAKLANHNQKKQALKKAGRGMF